jgi:hypothetical protein
MIDASHLIIGLSLAQLGAVFWLGNRVGKRDALLDDTAGRLHELEPEVTKLRDRFNILQGEHNARPCE